MLIRIIKILIKTGIIRISKVNEKWGKNQKRFYNRGTLRGIRISRWAKIPTLYRDWLRSFNRKRGNYLSRIDGKEGLKVNHCIAQKNALFDSLL